MNSFTHTFKIYYLALYIDYLILLFLRSQKQELCIQPLAFERILILHNPRWFVWSGCRLPIKESGRLGRHSLRVLKIFPVERELDTQVPSVSWAVSHQHALKEQCPSMQGPRFCCPHEHLPGNSKGNLCKGRGKRVRSIWHVKPEKVMKHS